MKTKREILKAFALNGSCRGIECNQCQYDNTKVCTNCSTLTDRLIRIGAMTILRMFPEKREFDINNVLTCVTVDKAKVGMKGYFGDNLAILRTEFENREQALELVEILDDKYMCRFRHSNGLVYSLFYPIEDMKDLILFLLLLLLLLWGIFCLWLEIKTTSEKMDAELKELKNSIDEVEE